MTTSLYSLNPLSYGSYVTQVTRGSGKLYVPVNRNYVGYAQFDHVSGVSAQSGQQGVPVNKLSILNTLIDRFLSVQSSPTGKITEKEAVNLSDEQIDTMIMQAQNQMKDVMQNVAIVPYAQAGATMPVTGAVFSLVI